MHSSEAAALLRLVNELGYELVVSNGTRSDLLQADPELRARRERALEKYIVLQPEPEKR